MKVDKVALNIGGQVFVTSRTTLTLEKDTFFYKLLIDEQFGESFCINGEYFIDRDPQHFPLILSYLRKRKINFEHLKENELNDLIDEVEFYGIKSLFYILKDEEIDNQGNLIIKKSDILTKKQFEKLLKSLAMRNKKYKLLYSGKKDGFLAKTFHSRCDNKGPTLVLVKSTRGFVFGGFTKLNWGNNSKTEDKSTCVFSLFGLNNEERYLVLHNSVSSLCPPIVSDPNFGPCFKDGSFNSVDSMAIAIRDCCDINSCYSKINEGYRLPSAFNDKMSPYERYYYLSGTESFLVDNIEVFSIHD
ncbi:hypothetical protein ABK040_007974 [Willaertia magna]